MAGVAVEMHDRSAGSEAVRIGEEEDDFTKGVADGDGEDDEDNGDAEGGCTDGDCCLPMTKSGAKAAGGASTTKEHRKSINYSVEDEDEESEWWERYLHTIKTSWEHTVLGYFPVNASADSEDLKKYNLSAPVATLYIFIFIITLVYLSYSQAMSIYSQKYLSPYGSDPGAYGQQCSKVSYPITATYSGNTYGFWDSNATFAKNTSIYVLEFLGTTLTEEDYAINMDTFTTKLKTVADKSMNRDMAFTIMAFSSFNAHNDTSRMSFYTNMRSDIFFSKAVVYQSFVSGPWGFEEQTLYSNVVVSDNGQTISMNVIPYVESGYTGHYGSYSSSGVTTMWRNLDWDNDGPADTWFTYYGGIEGAFYLGFSVVGTNPPQYKLSWDIRAIMLAVASNFGIVDPTVDLTIVASKSEYNEYGNFYIDAFNGAMDPIFCLNSIYSGPGGTAVCFVFSTSTQSFFYPVVYSTYSDNWSDQTIKKCTCPVPNPAAACTTAAPTPSPSPSPASFSPYCQDTQNLLCNNQVQIAINLLFWNNYKNYASPIAFGVKMKALITASPQDGDLDIVNYFTAVFDPAYTSLLAHQYDIYKTSASLNPYQYAYNQSIASYAGWSNICPDKDCAVITLITYKSGLLPLNEYNIELGDLTSSSTWTASNGVTYPQTSCTNTIYQASAIAAFYNPPVALTQPYLICHIKWGSALLTSIGAASGSAGLYSGVFMGGLIWVLVFALNRYYVPDGKYKTKRLPNGDTKVLKMYFDDESKNELKPSEWRFKKNADGERIAIKQDGKRKVKMNMHRKEDIKRHDVYLDENETPLGHEDWDFSEKHEHGDKSGCCAPNSRNDHLFTATSKTMKNDNGEPKTIHCFRQQTTYSVWHPHNPEWIASTDAKRHNREIHEMQEEKRRQNGLQEKVTLIHEKTMEIETVKGSVLASMDKIDKVHKHLLEEEKVLAGLQAREGELGKSAEARIKDMDRKHVALMTKLAVLVDDVTKMSENNKVKEQVLDRALTEIQANVKLVHETMHQVQQEYLIHSNEVGAFWDHPGGDGISVAASSPSRPVKFQPIPSLEFSALDDAADRVPPMAPLPPGSPGPSGGKGFSFW